MIGNTIGKIKKIDWKRTLILHLHRCFFAGEVLALICLIIDTDSFVALPSLLPQLLVFLPLGFFAIYVPLGLLFNFLARIGIPFIGLFSFFFTVFLSLGDPFVFLLVRFAPWLQSLQKFKPFNFHLIIFVYDDTSSEELETKKEMADSSEETPANDNKVNDNGQPLKNELTFDQATELFLNLERADGKTDPAPVPLNPSNEATSKTSAEINEERDLRAIKDESSRQRLERILKQRAKAPKNPCTSFEIFLANRAKVIIIAVFLVVGLFWSVEFFFPACKSFLVSAFEDKEILWDTAHENAQLPCADFSEQRRSKGLCGYLEKAGFLQRQSGGPKLTGAKKTFQGVIKAGENQIASTLVIPPNDEYMLMCYRPYHYEMNDIRIWLIPDFENSNGQKYDLKEIQINSTCDKRNNCSRTLLLKPQDSGAWKITLTRIARKFGRRIKYKQPTAYYISYGPSSIVLNRKILEDVRLLIITAPETIYFPSEIDAITSFVAEGGSLLLINTANQNGISSPFLNQLTRQFGFSEITEKGPAQARVAEFRKSGNWPENAIIEYFPFRQNEILNGISKVVAFRSAAFRIDDESRVQTLLRPQKGTALQGMYFDGTESPVVVATHKKGRVAAVGSPSFIEMEDGVVEIDNHELHYDSFDNAQLARNILEWLLHN